MTSYKASAATINLTESMIKGDLEEMTEEKLRIPKAYYPVELKVRLYNHKHKRSVYIDRELGIWMESTIENKRQIGRHGRQQVEIETSPGVFMELLRCDNIDRFLDGRYAKRLTNFKDWLRVSGGTVNDIRNQANKFNLI